jgi:ABC-2 type transport system permease protein
VQWGSIVKNLEVQAGYIALFGAAAWARFTTKDILA